MDPKKLHAFAGAGPEPTDDESGGDGEHEEGGEEEEQAEGEDRFAKLLPLLEENAEDIEDVADEVDGDVLTDPSAELSPEDSTAIQESLDDMPKDLTDAMREAFKGGLSHDDALELANHLEEEDMVEDAERIGGWLFRAAAVLQGGGGSDEGSEEEDETEEDEEEEPEEQESESA